jgi:hypothetical protein
LASKRDVGRVGAGGSMGEGSMGEGSMGEGSMGEGSGFGLLRGGSGSEGSSFSCCLFPVLSDSGIVPRLWVLGNVEGVRAFFSFLFDF